MKVELKIKSNGHKVCTKIVRKESIGDQISYYTQKYKLPINIVVSDINTPENVRLKQLQAINNQQQYDIQVLSEQVRLFQSQKQVQQYISTEKLLAHNVEEKMTKLCQALILVANQNFNKKRQLIKFSQLQAEVNNKNVTKQKLNEIEQKCFETLGRVREERKKMELCVVCWENMSNIILIPCMHFVMCDKCPKTRVCPVCKVVVQKGSVLYR